MPGASAGPRASGATPDRDEIHGGDGDDLIVGNQGLDRLWGERCRDDFIGELVELYNAPNGQENAVGGPVMIQPGETHEFQMNNAQIDKVENPDTTPSATMLREMRDRDEGFHEFAGRMSADDEMRGITAHPDGT